MPYFLIWSLGLFAIALIAPFFSLLMSGSIMEAALLGPIRGKSYLWFVSEYYDVTVEQQAFLMVPFVLQIILSVPSACFIADLYKQYLRDYNLPYFEKKRKYTVKPLSLLYPKIMLHIIRSTCAAIWRAVTTPALYLFIVPLLGFKYFYWDNFTVSLINFYTALGGRANSELYAELFIFLQKLPIILTSIFIALAASKSLVDKNRPNLLVIFLRVIGIILVSFVSIAFVSVWLKVLGVYSLSLFGNFVGLEKIRETLIFMRSGMLIDYLVRIPLGNVFVLAALFYSNQLFTRSLVAVGRSLKMIAYNYIPFLLYLGITGFLIAKGMTFIQPLTVLQKPIELFSLFFFSCLVVALYSYILSKQRHVYLEEELKESHTNESWKNRAL